MNGYIIVSFNPQNNKTKISSQLRQSTVTLDSSSSWASLYVLFLTPKLTEMRFKETHMDKNSDISNTGYPSEGEKQVLFRNH